MDIVHQYNVQLAILEPFRTIHSHVLSCPDILHILNNKINLLQEKITSIITCSSSHPTTKDEILRCLQRSNLLDTNMSPTSPLFLMLSQLVPSSLESFFAFYLKTNKSITVACIELMMLTYNDIWTPI